MLSGTTTREKSTLRRQTRMHESSFAIVRSLWPAWLLSALFPLPVVLFWQSDDGRFAALCCFFLSCVSLVAYAFRDIISDGDTWTRTGGGRSRAQVWRSRLVGVGFMLLGQWAAFSGLCLAINDASDLVAPALAFMSLIPSLCLAPYLRLATRKPVAAVVFTVFLVGSMKLLGCVVVVLVYGWDASDHGHTQLPWTHPNLLVWLFWSFTGLLSLSLHVLGKRRFCRLYGHAA